MSQSFRLCSDYKPSIDQQKVIDTLSRGIEKKEKNQLLVGVTGSGKTFSMANIIQTIHRPTLIITHNKTLTAQLYQEFKEFFPENAVEYFVSYYDYYQPEAYVPVKDLYIEKDSSINDDLDKLRLSATRSLFEREDVIIVSSVSCIYGLGSPEAYSGMMLYLTIGKEINRQEIFMKLVEIQYQRNDVDFSRGVFRVRGNQIDIYLAYEDVAIRIELFGDEVESLKKIDPLTGKTLESHTKYAIYPASHYVMPKNTLPQTLEMIEEELEEQYKYFQRHGKIVEAQRLKQRTKYDVEMIAETGTCSGIENYSRIMTRRAPGQAPPTLIDYFPKDSLLFLDESHVSLPQIRAMYNGDHSRKKNLVNFGFRLPSALDNRPLKYEEFEQVIHQKVYVSATPAAYEFEKSSVVVEQVIRPTGLLDPEIQILPIAGQVDNMYAEILKRIENNQRVLITTLTKKMAEDLSNYYGEMNLKTCYLHSEVNAIERTKILKDLREGIIDCLIGVNLLREGLDLPEVALIGIFDADKEGFLRSHTSLMQTCGRAARNKDGKVIMFADTITQSIQKTLDETERRRKIQLLHNEKHGITPQTIRKKIHQELVRREEIVSDKKIVSFLGDNKKLQNKIKALEKVMKKAAKNLDFETAAEIRDEIQELRKFDIFN
jgi:excinuclease ABC subunit B